LGAFSSAEKAAAAYEAARMRARLGEPVLLPKKEQATIADIRRWHYAPSEQLKFGAEGEAVIEVAPEQEQSVLISHHALNKLHPKVQKFILFASNTGDLAEAVELAGLSKEQVSMLLPRLKVLLGSLVERPIL
jgi:hypothetical protein